ncbi:DUF5776 domain-containing protein [Rummeliibacillus sp. NPDC094406]|uniref:DUF5776 domain-containing protein n=1 Tax=Rummeliibacillus sp. NPDC094406 TaxID=3364511 RepID=UPI003807B4F5
MKNVKLFVAIFVAMFVFTVSMHRANAEEFGPANPDSTTEWETTPIVVDTSNKNKLKLMSSEPSEPIIADISKWQGNIDWAKASKKLDLVIIRTQHGSTDEDTLHKKNEEGAKKYGVPFGVYAYSLAESTADAKAEANDFYRRTDKDALFYVIDVEQNTSKSGESMRAITNAYIEQLRSKTDKKIGLYIAHHLYNTFNLDTSKADFVWIPRYSTTKPSYSYDLWQYTDRGRIDGINANVDLNRLNPNITIEQFLDNNKSSDDESNVDSDQDFDENEDKSQDESEPASVHIDYYTENPEHIILNADTAQYSNSNLDESSKTANLKKGKVFSTVAVVKSKQDKWALKLENGQYIIADKKNAIKVTKNISSYYTEKPSHIILLENIGAYSSTKFNNATKIDSVKKNTILTIKDIEYTSSGVPRFKTVSGSYITANKSYTHALTSKYKNYILTKPTHVKLLANVYQYSSTTFNSATKRQSLAKGNIVNVKSISFTSAGTPRLKLENGNYITANKSYVVAK